MVTKARTWQSLVEEASTLFEEAVSAQKDGKWSDYGEKLGALELTLKDLIESARKD